MCHERWALYVVIKQKVIYIYIKYIYNILCYFY